MATDTNIGRDRGDSVLDDVEEKIESVWATLRDKPTDEDLAYEEKEKSLYHGQLLPTRSEILAWYLYDWANSPMFNVMMGLVIPLYLSALAREYGCENETKYGCDVEFEPIEEDIDLFVYMGTWKLKPESFTFTVISISGALQAVAYISIGALADYGSYQFYLFRICTLIASIMPIVFFFINNANEYLFAGWWVAFQLVFFGLALVFYNAYLPQIVENHWVVRRAIRANKSTEKVCAIKQQISDDMSQYGFACGYFGSLFMVMVATAIFAVTETTENEQLTGFGLTSGTSHNEEWLKPVKTVEMIFESGNLRQIQLLYDGMDIDGGIYGDASLNTNIDTYEVEDNDYIASIDYWLNNDRSINSMRFITQKGLTSDIYGSATGTDPAETTTTDGDNFIFAGYITYTDTDDNVTGMDVLMLNQDTGQFQSILGSRIIALIVFLWWNIFQLFCFKYFKRRDGPPLPDNSSPWTFGTLQFIDAIKQAKKWPHMFRYLLAWFCFSDGLNTLSTTAVIFATVELNMTSTEAALLILIALLMGSFGGVLFLYIQRKIEWDAKRMLMIHICTFICLCLYGMLGLIPDIPFGLVHKGELYVFVIVYGLNWGSIQSYARSVFAYLVPIGKESQMFALYEITDKGSSWIGPLMVALITNISSIRWGMFYVTSFFVIAMPLLIWGVDLQTGMKQAGRWKTIDPNDPNLAGLEGNKDIATPKNGKVRQIKQGEVGFNRELSTTSATADNYHNPRMKITVTSIDEESEMRKQQAIENGIDMNGIEMEEINEEEINVEEDPISPDPNLDQNNNNNNTNDIDKDLKPKLHDEVASTTDDDDDDENNHDEYTQV